MEFVNLWSWMTGRKPSRDSQRTRQKHKARLAAHPLSLEERTVPAGYLAIGAGVGAPPLVAIRCDIIDSVNGAPPNSAGQPPVPTSDGRTDVTSQVLQVFNGNFRGGVKTASGNFDGNATTPDQLVTAAGPSGGPHVIIWDMAQAADGKIFFVGKRAEFMAYDIRFTGGVNVACGDLDGDGVAELITAPAGAGGPHVKIWKLDLNTNQVRLVNEFLAFEPSFTGGVNISSGQGYQAPYQIRQVLSQQLPAAQNGPFGSNFLTVPYENGQTVPGAAQGIPLVGGLVFLPPPSNTPDPGNVPLNLPYFSVGGGTFQFGGANLLNSLGNIVYEPNVIDPLGQNRVPPQQPLIMASWGANDANRPDFAIPGVNYGPFVQISPGVNGPPVITRLQAPSGQPNARNQLVLAPGVGGGPIVRVFDFVANGNNLAINDTIAFNAFADDPTLANSRTGLNVAIGNVVENPNPLPDGRIMPNVMGAELGDPGITFPFSTNYYRQGTAQIIISQASGGRRARVFADYNPANFITGRPAERTSISQLDLRPVLLRTESVFDPNNPLNGYQSVVDFSDFNIGVDGNFVGNTFTAVSHLPMTFTLDTLQPNRFMTAANTRGANIFGAGPVNSGTNRGPRIRIFDNMGPNDSFILSDGINPDSIPVSNGSPIFSGGTTPYLFPLDEFVAFTGPASLVGIGSVSFGLGALPTARVATVELPPITVNSISNPILV